MIFQPMFQNTFRGAKIFLYSRCSQMFSRVVVRFLRRDSQHFLAFSGVQVDLLRLWNGFGVIILQQYEPFCTKDANQRGCLWRMAGRMLPVRVQWIRYTWLQSNKSSPDLNITCTMLHCYRSFIQCIIFILAFSLFSESGLDTATGPLSTLLHSQQFKSKPLVQLWPNTEKAAHFA